MSFNIPVQMTGYDGKKYMTVMGPFEHSTEREFAMMVNKRAIDDCQSVDQLRPVAKNLLEGWSLMNTALQRMMLENIQLRQAIDQRDADLEAAEELISDSIEAIEEIKKISYEQQSKKTKSSLWPWKT